MPGRDSSTGRARGGRRSSPFARLAAFGALARAESRWPRTLGTALALLPAALAGYELAILTLFLNPHLERSAGAIASGTVRGALLFAPLSLVAHLYAKRRRRVRVARLLPWSLTVVLVTAALADWVHASRFSYYLAPPLGANLIKLALWLSLAAILVFYTALLHTVSHRRYGARSVFLLVFVAVGSLYVARARLVSHRPQPLSRAAQVTAATAAVPRIAVVVVDGATLDVLLPLARQSRLPFFSKLFEAGASARLAAVSPVVPFAARATLATGKLPWRHGLVESVFLDSFWLPRRPLKLAPFASETLGLAGPATPPRPAAASDRRTRTFWEVIAAAGTRSAVLGTPAALLGSDALSYSASDDLFYGRDSAPARPESFDGRIRLLAGAGDGASSRLDPAVGAHAPLVTRAIGQDRFRLEVAESLVAGIDEVELLVVELPGFFDVALATRAGFEAAELEGARGAAERESGAALTAFAAALDSGLERLWERLESPRLLAVVSPHGVDRPRGVSRLAREIARIGRLGGTLSGQPDGALWLLGEGVARPGASIPSARAVDVAPTLLYVAGLPIARDLDGRVLTEALEPALLQRQPLTFVPTYGTPAP